MTRTKGTRNKGKPQDGERSEWRSEDNAKNITRKRMQMGTEKKQSYAKKPYRISISEINEKNALIMEGMHVQTEKQKNKCGANT